MDKQIYQGLDSLLWHGIYTCSITKEGGGVISLISPPKGSLVGGVLAVVIPVITVLHGLERAIEHLSGC